MLSIKVLSVNKTLVSASGFWPASTVAEGLCIRRNGVYSDIIRDIPKPVKEKRQIMHEARITRIRPIYRSALKNEFASSGEASSPLLFMRPHMVIEIHGVDIDYKSVD